MSLLMSQVVGSSGQVYSFEPGPVSFPLLSRNIFVNQTSSLSKIILKNEAISSCNSKVPLFINPFGESDNQIHLNENEYVFNNELPRQKVVVNATTLDSYANLIDFDNVSFIKLDTQRSRYEIFLAAKDVLSAPKNLTILCEFAPYLKALTTISIENFYDLISSLGFIVYDTRHSLSSPVSINYLWQTTAFISPQFTQISYLPKLLFKFL